VTTNDTKHNEVSITPEKITLRFGEMEPVVVPRTSLRTRLQLIDWVYRLTGWPGMSVQGLRAFIAAVFQHHGWGLSEAKDAMDDQTLPDIDTVPRLAAAVPA
jgi:hypothetical protein